ncbi:sigma-70 family RNA polymerase sigma factor [Selenomonas caprae]|uniref:RNA polymerase, sigma 30 subunit, SigH n=2 Tax=Selenomonas TaxID=970 RepID=A0A1I3IGB1_SELRU|nr:MULTISPECIES: sigma-70 family RNA polymerase sigma factor [Selenomonas]MBQ1889627.1 sigma-70 family RNA polymerase sigma factor [Selenomonas sp.]TYZ29147.1 sigma-70 family RNA polymerase sigma factor [Selenomonas caprae]SFI47008.1 RNA polymerase, sigma 30 subunit, SigH [Selenomonas ruminantium]
MDTNKAIDLILEYQKTGDPQLGSKLVAEYDYLVTNICRPLYMNWAEHDDLLQEGRIGLYKALKDYQADRGVSFVSFASRCIRCECISAINKANRYKHAILNQALSLNASVFEDNEKTSWIDTLIDPNTQPLSHDLILQEEYESCRKVLSQILSPYAYAVFIARLRGGSYDRISQQLGHDSKSIDNALQRCRQRISTYLAGNDDEMDSDALRHFCQVVADNMMPSTELSQMVS